MKSIKDIPFRIPDGPIDGRALSQILGVWQREILAEFDIRNAQAFPGAVEANSDGTVTLGRYSQVTDQRTLPQVSAGNRLSAQNINPLSSTGSPSTAQIAIAAHTVQYGFGTVSYGTGTITGLTPLATYYVYADDADFEGGSVTYTASTSGTTVVAANGRYFVGAITTANSTPTGTITAATSANPIAFTSAGHGLTSGQTVQFASLPGDFGTNLNGNQYTVTVTGLDTFTIPVDGSGYAAYTTGGTWTRVVTATSGAGGAGFDPNYQTP
jgi:hypothetical protein